MKWLSTTSGSRCQSSSPGRMLPSFYQRTLCISFSVFVAGITGKAISHLYPPDIDGHWFGLFMDAIGICYTASYKKTGDGMVQVNICNKYQLQWIDGDRRLGYIVCWLMLSEVVEMAGSAKFDHNDSHLTKMMDGVKLKNYELIRCIQSIQQLQTKSARNRHFENLTQGMVAGSCNGYRLCE